MSMLREVYAFLLTLYRETFLPTVALALEPEAPAVFTWGKYGEDTVIDRRDSRLARIAATLFPGAWRSHTESARPPLDAMNRPYGRLMPFPPVLALDVSDRWSIFSASIFVGAFSLDEDASKFEEWSLLAVPERADLVVRKSPPLLFGAVETCL